MNPIDDIARQATALEMRVVPGQASLTQKLLEPRLEEILEALRQFRGEVDEDFAQKVESARRSGLKKQSGELSLHRYPIGFCRHIRDGVFKRMLASPLFQDLTGRGLELRQVFIFLKGEYFQNAIQLGNYYLDAANDTVYPEKPKLDWAPVHKVQFENLESWKRFAEVASKYLKVELYPNLLFPIAFPLAPFFALRANGRIDLILAQNLIFMKDLGDGMRRAVELLETPSLMSRKLPEFYQQAMYKAFGGNLFQAFPLEYAAASPQEIRQGIVAEFEALTRNPPPNAMATIKQFSELVTRASHQLQLRNLIPPPDVLEELRATGHIQASPNATEDATVE